MNNLSIEEAFELFVYDRLTYCEKKTVNNYKNTIRYLIEFLEELKGLPRDNIKINTITTKDLKDYIIMLRDRDKLSTHRLKPTVSSSITNRTIRTYLIDVRTFFNFLMKEEIIEFNPMAAVKIVKSENKIIKPLLQDEVLAIDNLFNLKTETGLRNYCIIHLMLDCGLRSGDVCKLTVMNVDFDHDLIYLDNGKGRKDRIVILPAKLKLNLKIKKIKLYIKSKRMRDWRKKRQKI